MHVSRLRKDIWNQRGLPISRYQRLSLTDFPGRLCAKVVVPGCNFRCPYCLKQDLIFDYLGHDRIPEKEILSHLFRVKDFLSGLCIGGGEPTLHNGLLQFCYKIRSMGFHIKIDTNGTRPKRLKKLMEERLVDYIAMDIKAPIDRYSDVVLHKVDVKAVDDSVKTIRRGSTDYEFRSTMVPGLLDALDLEEIAQYLVGSKRFVIRRHKPGDCLDLAFAEMKPYSKKQLMEFRDLVAPFFAECMIEM